MCRLGPYKGIQRGPRIGYGNHVQDAVLPTLEEDEVACFHRRRDVSDSQVVAAHVMNANRRSEHGER